MRKLGWNNGIVGVVILGLTQEGAKIEVGNFALYGSIQSARVTLNARKLWEKVPEGTLLSVDLSDVSLFGFNEGGLTSDYLPGDEIA